MIMPEVFNAVPVGQPNALASRDIWKIADCWAECTFANKLALLAARGFIQEGKEQSVSGFRYVYWREAV